MPHPSTSSASTSTAKSRRSSLTFKGPTTDKRIRAPPKLVQPQVPKRASSSATSSRKGKDTKKRRSSTAVVEDVGPSRVARANEAKRGQSSKARGKKRQLEEEEEEDDLDADEDEGNDATDEDVVKQKWKILSEGSREDLRWEAEKLGRELLDSLSGSSSRSSAYAQEVQKILSRFADELDSLLLTLPLPPLPSAIKRASKGKGRAGEVDLGWVLDMGEVKSRIAQLDQACELEQAEVDALSARVEEEQRLLEEEESAITTFTEMREKLRAAESADLAAQSSHPLLRPLLTSRLALRDASSNRSVNLAIPGLSKPRALAKNNSRATVSREWLRPDAPPAGPGGGKKKRKRVEEDEAAEEEESGPCATLLRATREARRLLQERKKARKTSE
ncbi:hypothetical protein JCM11251_000991 [Rhodosporidiobolus azoricus]